MVFFEGLDKTGKTELCRKVRFIGGHTIPFYERGFISRKVFREFRKEIDFPIEDWMRIEKYLIAKQMYAVVWLQTNYATIVKRHETAGEICEFTEKEFEQQNLLYQQHMESLIIQDIPILPLHTDYYSIEDCVETILKWAGVI